MKQYLNTVASSDIEAGNGTLGSAPAPPSAAAAPGAWGDLRPPIDTARAMQDDFEVETPQVEDGKQPGVSPKPPRSAKAKRAAAVCAAKECSIQALTNQKWCKDHKQAAAAMLTQAESKGSAAKKKHHDMMQDPVMSIEAMAHWCECNPIGARWKRKSHVDFD